MEIEKSQDGGAQPTEEKPVVDEVVTPAVEENVDENEDLSEFGVPPMPAEGQEEEKEEPGDKPEVDNQGKSDEEKEINLPKIASPDPRPTRLDKRLAQVYRQNLILSGETNIPTEEDALEDLKKYSQQDKIFALNTHLAERKKLRGERPSENNFEEEDFEAIEDAKREAIRQEVLEEENTKKVLGNFVDFIDQHTELIPDDPENKKKFPNKKKYDPKLAKAVETLFNGGMSVDEAFETVTESISSVKADEKKEAELRKQRALSGAVGASNDSSSKEKKMTWTEFDKLRTDDPDRYERLLDEGYEPSDE